MDVTHRIVEASKVSKADLIEALDIYVDIVDMDSLTSTDEII